MYTNSKATYQTTGREKNEALEALLNDVRDFAERHSNSPEAAAWHGIIPRECIKNRGRSRSANTSRSRSLVISRKLPLTNGDRPVCTAVSTGRSNTGIEGLGKGCL